MTLSSPWKPRAMTPWPSSLLLSAPPETCDRPRSRRSPKKNIEG